MTILDLLKFYNTGIHAMNKNGMVPDEWEYTHGKLDKTINLSRVRFTRICKKNVKHYSFTE